MTNKTYEIEDSDTSMVVSQLFDLCMKMQKKSEDGQDKQFTELVKNLSGLVNKLNQDDIKQMILDLEELISDTTEGRLRDEETTKGLSY